jgi:hypothetical protein
MELASQKFVVKSLNIMTKRQEDAGNVTYLVILALATLKIAQVVVLVGCWIYL